MTPGTLGRLAIVGTAGHIDHGKTSLVRRMTGVDTDRLPEEKKRGISIDLGFAPFVTPAGVHVGLVDVPGHEKFVKNMLAGAGGIDLVLLVIAADEGVMPQTREHLAIVQLLGVKRGIVVLTKRDLVDAEFAAMVARDVRELLAGGPLAEAPIVEFSATTGDGQAELVAELDRQLAAVVVRPPDEPARLPVDRVFTVEGFGTVVTGTLWRGSIATGDALDVMPEAHNVRVRRVQVHGETVDRAHAGQRTAVALHGISKDQVARGDWLVAPDTMRESHVLDVRFELLPDVGRDWKADTRVRFHLGASEIIGRLVLLEGNSLAPGGSAIAQLRLERATVAARGDRFVIRSYSPPRTVGGGTVIEPVSHKRRRAAAGLSQIELLESGTVDARVLEKLAAHARPASVDAVAQDAGEPVAAVQLALDRLRERGEAMAAGARWVATTRWNAARDAVTGVVHEFVQKHPARYGVMKGELKSGLKAAMDSALFDAVFDALVAAGDLEQRGERVRTGGLPWEPPAATLAALERVERELEATGYLVPEASAWQAKLGAAAPEVVALGFFLGRLVRVSQELTYTAAQMLRLKMTLESWFKTHPTLTVASFRDLTGASRKYAVPLLEHTDRLGWTMRVGDERKWGG